MVRCSSSYWMRRTGIGISFGASTLLGLLVGLMMVGQSLYALALDHVEDFATLKALGAEDRHVCRVILLQSLAIAAAGSLAGITIVLAIRQFWSSPLAPVEIPSQLVALAVVFVFVICLAASLLPFIWFSSIQRRATPLGQRRLPNIPGSMRPGPAGQGGRGGRVRRRAGPGHRGGVRP